MGARRPATSRSWSCRTAPISVRVVGKTLLAGLAGSVGTPVAGALSVTGASSSPYTSPRRPSTVDTTPAGSLSGVHRASWVSAASRTVGSAGPAATPASQEPTAPRSVPAGPPLAARTPRAPTASTRATRACGSGSTARRSCRAERIAAACSQQASSAPGAWRRTLGSGSASSPRKVGQPASTAWCTRRKYQEDSSSSAMSASSSWSSMSAPPMLASRPRMPPRSGTCASATAWRRKGTQAIVQS
jgi:hypothetical protein